MKRGKKPRIEKVTPEVMEEMLEGAVVVSSTSPAVEPVLAVPKVAVWLTVKFEDGKKWKVSAATVARKLVDKGMAPNAADLMADPAKLIELAGKLYWTDLQDRVILVPHAIPNYIAEWPTAEKGVIGE